MKPIVDYLNEVFGVNLSIVRFAKTQTSSLPFYITHEYEFWKGRLVDRDLVFAKKLTADHFTPDQYKKQLALLEGHFNSPVVFVLADMEAYQRNRLIQKQVSFAIAGKQLFVPALFIDIKEYNLKVQKKEYLQPAAQCLVLYHLQRGSLNQYKYKQLADVLKYPYLTITRAVENIRSLDLCYVEGTKEKEIFFEADKTELWEKALPYMTNPAVKKVFSNGKVVEELFFRSNMNALAYYTDLNDEDQIYFAVHQDVYRILEKEKKIQDLNEREGKYCIEQWRYNPEVLTDSNYVDPLSVYLQFRDSTDERVQLALKTIIQQQKW